MSDLVDDPRVDSWLDFAACVGADVDLFFPARGVSTDPAKAVCAACPVRVQCLEHALANNEEWGVWGGTSRKERKRMRRQVAA